MILWFALLWFVSLAQAAFIDPSDFFAGTQKRPKLCKSSPIIFFVVNFFLLMFMFYL
jgi:hypothetical protein